MAGKILPGDSRLTAHADSQKALAKPFKWDDKNPKNGPTVKQWADAGQDPKSYPPAGYESKSSKEEIAAAIAAYQPK